MISKVQRVKKPRTRTIRRCINCTWYLDDPLFLVGECFRTGKAMLPDGRCGAWLYTRDRYLVLYRQRDLANMQKIVKDKSFFDGLIA